LSFTRKTRATSRDISLWVVFVKVDDERNVHSDPPYCGYQTGTCTTCGSGNLPRAAYTCHDLFAECPTIRARHERRSLDRPHSASMILSLRERRAGTWIWDQRQSCGTDRCSLPVHLASLWKNSAISTKMKNEVSHEREEIDRRIFVGSSRKRPGKRKKNCGLL